VVVRVRTVLVVRVDLVFVGVTRHEDVDVPQLPAHPRQGLRRIPRQDLVAVDDPDPEVPDLDDAGFREDGVVRLVVLAGGDVQVGDESPQELVVLARDVAGADAVLHLVRHEHPLEGRRYLGGPSGNVQIAQHQNKFPEVACHDLNWLLGSVD